MEVVILSLAWAWALCPPTLLQGDTDSSPTKIIFQSLACERCLKVSANSTVRTHHVCTYWPHQVWPCVYLHCLMFSVLHYNSIYFMLHLPVNTLRLEKWPWNSLTSGALLKVILTMIESLCNASCSPVTGSHCVCTINNSIILLMFNLRCRSCNFQFSYFTRGVDFYILAK